MAWWSLRVKKLYSVHLLFSKTNYVAVFLNAKKKQINVHQLCVYHALCHEVEGTVDVQQLSFCFVELFVQFV